MDKMELSKRLEQLVGEAAAQEGRLEMTRCWTISGMFR